MKIVINRCYGGFGLSKHAFELYLTLKGIAFETTEPRFKLTDNDLDYWKAGMVGENKGYLYDREIDRDDPVLVRVVEELGEDASGRFAELKVVDVPDDVKWYIDEYDGSEWVAEQHRTWK